MLSSAIFSTKKRTSMVHTRVQWEVSMAADKPCPQLQPSLLSTRIEVFRSLIGKIEIKLTCFRDLLTFRIPTYIWTFSLRKLNFFTTLLLDFIKIDQDLENHYLNLPTLKTLIRAKFFLLFLRTFSQLLTYLLTRFIRTSTFINI